MGEEGGPAADRIDDAQRDIPLVGALGQQAHNLAFGKDGAHAGDVDGLVSLHKLVDVVDVLFQNAHHHLDKAAGAGCALIVHDEVHDV